MSLSSKLRDFRKTLKKKNKNAQTMEDDQLIAIATHMPRDNESLKKVAEERNQLVNVVNERTTALNDTINKFNTFVAQVEQAQAAAKATAEKK